jgi:hypothetical protein
LLPSGEKTGLAYWSPTVVIFRAFEPSRFATQTAPFSESDHVT